jgi:hypothetical protein
MPNRIADSRRRVVYIEDKDVWETLTKIAKKTGQTPSNIVRSLTRTFAEMNKDVPEGHFGFIQTPKQ